METVTLTRASGLATVRLGREHGNAINPPLVHDLAEAFREIAADDTVRGVLLAASGKLFCPGLDLTELIELDREGLGDFMARFNLAVLGLYRCEKPVVAALHGHAVAGGCVIALTADWRVIRRGALIGLNEVRVGVPLPFGVSLILRESVRDPRLEEVALFGRNYADEEAVDTGLAHEVHPPEGFEEHCLVRLEELASKDARAFSITKRFLRLQTVERIAADGPGYEPEFLDAWFSPETQTRLGQVVSELRSRK